MSQFDGQISVHDRFLGRSEHEGCFAPWHNIIYSPESKQDSGLYTLVLESDMEIVRQIAFFD